MASDNRELTFVEAVLSRPAMYTACGTFEEAVAFLDGYSAGLAGGYAAGIVNAKKGEVTDQFDVPRFKEWHGLKLDLANRLDVGVARLHGHFRDQFDNSDAAKAALLIYAQEYFDSQSSANVAEGSGT